MKSIALTAFVMMFVAACAGETGDSSPGLEHLDDDVDVIDTELRDGAVTYAHPEVGVLVDAKNALACTGTLVAPNVVLTAGHCVRRASKFLIRGSAKSSFVAFAVVEGEDRFGAAPGEADLGLLRLKDDVPAKWATPAKLSKFAFAKGRKGTVFGYGMLRCDKGGATPSDGQKRAKQIVLTSSSHKQIVAFAKYSTCPGDSGGPLFFGNEIAAVVSGGNQPVPVGANAIEIWADIADDRGPLGKKIRAWDALQ
jgi:V8-like Glu-specific endopeptidase